MPEPSTITFYVKRDGKTSTYTADPGMTWWTFCEHPTYNRDKFWIPDIYIEVKGTSSLVLHHNSTLCEKDDTIINGATYEFKPY